MNRHSRKFVFTAIFVCSCVPHPDDQPSAEARESSEIVGGSSADIADLPWQIALYSTRFGSFFCGGSVIDEGWVLTAAHCVDGEPASSLFVVAGISRHSQANSGQIRRVSQSVVFPGFITPERGKDVALLQLETPLDLSAAEVEAIPIMTGALAAQGLTAPGTNGIVSGWGSLSSGGGSPDQLQSVVVPLLSQGEVDAAYRSVRITDDQLGAGLLGIGGRDSCQGDSGGPLAVPNPGGGFALAGVVSWGFGCASPNFPGLYARVSAFESWIVNTTGISVGQPPPPPGGWSASAEPSMMTVDNGQACTTLTVSDTGDAGAAQIDLVGQHDWRSILRATLEHNGEVREVFATGTFGRGAGTFRLENQAISGFSGDAQGDWTLCLIDTDAFGDTGVLLTWGVHD